MTIKSDRWIRRMAAAHGMIEPFVPGQVREGETGRLISYGTSSYGYDVRCADEFKIFTNINSAIVDPKNFDSNSFVDLKSDVCIIPPNSFALARTVEYFRIPRNVLVLCLGKSTYARCFSADTRVALADGSTPTLEEMATRAGRGELFWGYSVGPFGRITVALLEAPRWVGRDALLEVTLDNQKVIHCTPDHEMMLRDGRLLPAHRLRPGDSLMPLYRQLVHGYDAEDRGEDFESDEHSQSIREAFEGLRQEPGWQEHLNEVQCTRAPPFWDEDHDADTRNLPRRNHKVVSVREQPGDHDVYCLTVPETGNFALAAGVFVSNCGIIVNVTPLEPEWEGHVTLEFSNTTTLPAKIYANEGVAQILFFESDEVCETSYRDRGGKYQGQRGVTLPKS